MSLKVLNLKSQKDFGTILKNGSKFYSKSLIAICQPSPSHKQYNPQKGLNAQQFCRVGFIVSKKVSKLAVKRNRSKRIMRQAFKILADDYCKLNYDYCLIARAQMIDNDFKSIKNDLYFCLKNLRRLSYDKKN